MISSITPKIRHHVIYDTSLYVKQYVPKTTFVKTGIMLDLGETDESVCGKWFIYPWRRLTFISKLLIWRSNNYFGRFWSLKSGYYKRFNGWIISKISADWPRWRQDFDDCNPTFCKSRIYFWTEQLFEHTGKCYFKGDGLAQISYMLSNHQLKGIRLSGDLFSNLDRDSFESALIGTVFDQKTISEIITNQLDTAPIMGISADQLTSMLFSSELN